MLIKSNVEIPNTEMNHLKGDTLKVENSCLFKSIKLECLIKLVHNSLSKQRHIFVVKSQVRGSDTIQQNKLLFVLYYHLLTSLTTGFLD